MKAFVSLLLFTGISMVVLGQTRNCKSLHTGSFKVFTKESGTTYITRTNKFQTEKNEDLDYEIIFDITWLDECTYELRPKEIIKGDPSILGNGHNVLKTKIKKVTDQSYVAETSANFSEGVMDFVVEIIN